MQFHKLRPVGTIWTEVFDYPDRVVTMYFKITSHSLGYDKGYEEYFPVWGENYIYFKRRIEYKTGETVYL